MIWRALCMGFLLNKNDIIKHKVNKSHFLLCETIPENIYADNSSILSNLYKIRFQSAVDGLDSRHNATEQVDDELIYNISRFFYKQKLLKTLEDNTVSIHTKLENIRDYESQNYPLICAPNIQAGGLWDEWINDK
jgi:hypothetical protein